VQQGVGGDEVTLAVFLQPGAIGIDLVKLRVAARHDHKAVLRQQSELGVAQPGIHHEIHAAQIHRRDGEIARVSVRELERQRVRAGVVAAFQESPPVPLNEAAGQRRRPAGRYSSGQGHSRRGDHRHGYGHIQRDRRLRHEDIRLDPVLAIRAFRDPDGARHHGVDLPPVEAGNAARAV